jgi:hypothetical protein
MIKRILLSIALFCALPVIAPRDAAAAEEVEAFARVVVERAEVRSGPGASYRSIATLERGETVAVDRRGSDQFWLKVVLEDGRNGWVLGDEVEVYAVKSSEPDKPSRPGLFAPPPLLDAHGGMAILAGGAGSTVGSRTGSSYYAVDGYFEARPIWVLAPQISIEPWAGISRTDDGTLVNVGGWGVVHLLPDLAVDPYLGAGGGRLWTRSNADALVPNNDALWVARAGGGFLFGLRGRILVRLEATNMTLFTANRFKNMQTFLAGLGVYF